MGGGDGSRYDSELAALAREKYLWNFWEQPIPTKTFCGQAADVHVGLPKEKQNQFAKAKGEDETMTNSICPKCNYERTGQDSNIPIGECPKCGIIYEKYYQGIIKKLNEQNNIISKKIEEFNASKKYIEDKLEGALSDNLAIKNEYEKRINELSEIKKENCISLKPLLTPLWILIILNIFMFGYETMKTGKVKGVAVTPVFIQGVKDNLPVVINSSKTLPISIEYVSGNIPVAIKEPLAIGGSVCANPCR